MHVRASGRTIKQYFNTEVIGKEVINSVHALELVGTFLGRSKKQLDAVDTSVPLNMAVQSFRGFLRYHASSCGKAQNHSARTAVTSTRTDLLLFVNQVYISACTLMRTCLVDL